MQPKLKELIIASFSFEEHSPLYLKVLMLNAVMFITAVISFSFLIINIFLMNNYSLARMDILVFITITYALYLLRYKNDHTTAGYIGTAALFFIHLTIVFTQGGEHFTLIWSYFFAPFAIVALGAKRGLLITALYLLALFIISFIGIGFWAHGYWDISSYFRFVFSHFAMLYIMYAIFHANEKAADKIEELCDKGRDRIRHFERLSLTDPLTGLYNRRFLNEVFPKQFIDAKRDKKTLAFFLLDIDFFKSYNDTHGHQKGDEVLIKISKILKKELQGDTNYAFRIGGDEFAGILSANTKQEIRVKTRQLHHHITQLHISYKESPVKPFITASIGVHILTEGEYDFKTIYEETDIALYNAKAQGRDRIIIL